MGANSSYYELSLPASALFIFLQNLRAEGAIAPPLSPYQFMIVGNRTRLESNKLQP